MRCAFRRTLLRFNDARHSSTFTLRPYQEACLSACIDALDAGTRRVGVSLPTGAGKTAVFVSLLSRLESRYESDNHATAKGSLVIVNSIELARQTALLAQKMRPDWDVDIEQGVRYQASGKADLTVATYQTLLRTQRLQKFSLERIGAVVVDEAHHAAAPSYRRILSYFDPEIRSPDLPAGSPQPLARLHPAVPIFGFSATFSRHDGLALGSVFQRIVYHRDFLDMIKEQWLCNVRFTTVRANIDLKQVTISSRTGDFSATGLAHVINTDTVNKLVVQSWMDRARDRKSTLVFCVNLAHVRDLTNTFRSFGVDARYLHSGTSAIERKELVNKFRNGEYPVLVNCAILTEGADIPNIDCVIVARPTRSRNVFAQMIGRGMRLSPQTGKQDCRIIDFVDITNRMDGVVSTPTLFGLDPSEIIDDISTEDLERRSDAVALGDTASDEQNAMDDVPEPKSVTFTDYEDPFALVRKSTGASPHVAKLSRNEWVGCGGEIYVLECLGKGHIRIEPVVREDGEGTFYRAHFAPAMKLSSMFATNFVPFQQKRHVLDAESISDAVRGCDTYVSTKVLKGPLAVGLFRTAKWRQQPATSNQKTWIANRWMLKLAKEDREVDTLFPDRVAKLTKGEAANIITRIKHGALTRYAKKMKAVTRAAAARQKEQKRQARESVSVGPLPQEADIEMLTAEPRA